MPILGSRSPAGTPDVTSTLSPLHRAERALLDSETRLQQVMDNTSALVFAKDSRGRYLFVNREFERFAARPSSELIGRTDEELFSAELATRFRHNDLRVLHERRAIEFEESGDPGDGARTFLSAKFPLYDSDGAAYAVCGIATDITERKRLEEALTRAALAVSESEGETLYRGLVRYLATILGVEGAFIATADPSEPERLQMLAFHLDGETQENFSYPKAGTPCETVIGQSFRFYPEDLVEKFPLDLDFKKLGLESYAGHPLTDSAGRPLGLISVISRSPLTQLAFVESVLRIFAVRVNAELERLAADEAVRASEASYREIFEASDDAIFVHDWDTGAIVDVNPKACAGSGYTRDELLDTRLADLGSGEPHYTEADGLRWMEQAKREGYAGFEWQRRNKDGSVHWDQIRLKAARIGGHARVLAYARDITDERLQEQRLRRSEDRLRATVTTALDCIVVMDHHGQVIEFNPTAEACFGYRRADALGRRLADLMIPERYRAAHERGMERFISGQEGAFIGRRIEICALRADGSEFPVELAISVAKGLDGPIFIGYLRDISELKSAEQRRLRLETQLRQAQKMEAIGQLTGGIAHDFNNLLTSIMGYVTLAHERDAVAGDPRLRGYLAQAQRSCERARDLIQQMLLFSRGQRGSPQVIALGPIIEQTLDTVRPALPVAVVLSAEIADDLPPVSSDPLQVDQVLLNLCINARDAVDGSGAVRVFARTIEAEGLVCSGCRASVEGKFVEMGVEDDGHGITPDVLERIFEPFFSTKEPGKGTGMGLAMVHGIVHELGGHVVVDSEPGRGSRFRVLWPALPAGETDASIQAAREAPEPQRARPTFRGSVLVVDDEQDVGNFMRELLETWGLDAEFVTEAQTALDVITSHPGRFDAVITDQAMPRMTGLQLAEALRAICRDLPVFLYTGYGHVLDGPSLSAAGVRSVLDKPVNPASLQAALSKVLAGDRSGQ